MFIDTISGVISVNMTGNGISGRAMQMRLLVLLWSDISGVEY